MSTGELPPTVTHARRPARTDHMSGTRRRTIRRLLLAAAVAVMVLVTTVVGLFTINGLWLAAGQTPLTGGPDSIQPSSAAAPGPGDDGELRVLAYNIAKAFAIDDVFDPASTGEVRRRLQRVADVINAEQPNIVFLQEVVIECGPCPVDQLAELRRLTDMPYWAFGENFNFGLPTCRVVCGNAILSRHPIEAIDNASLPGRQPFYSMRNNRRVLLCSMNIAGDDILLASIHNDTYNVENNHRQVRYILERIGDRPAILAGDFNARPGSPSIETLREANRFGGPFDGPDTFRSNEPSRRIDYIFAPAEWTVLEHRAICAEASDHCAVLSVFEVE